VQITLFIILKDRIPKLYQPKSFLVSARQRVKPIAPGVFRWIKPLFTRNDEEFLRIAGLDGFFLCRYLIVLLWILGPAALLFIPVLIPLNLTGGGGLVIVYTNGTTSSTAKGMDRLTVSNISPEHLERLWAHYILAVLLVIWTCYIMYSELRRFIKVRQAYLAAPQHRIRASASTVLIQSLPKKYINQDALASLFDVYPGGIRNIWLNRDYNELAKLIKKRNKMAKKLEKSETSLIRKCWAAHLKKLKSSKSDVKTIDMSLTGDGISANNPGQVHHTVDEAVIAANYASMLDTLPTAPDTIVKRGIGSVTKGIRGVGDGLGSPGKGVVVESQSGLLRVLSKKPRRSADALEEDSNGHANEALSPTHADVLEKEAVHRKSLYEKPAFNADHDNDSNFGLEWRKYIKEKNRDTMRLVEQWTWCPGFINPKAKRVDTIYYCRRELARLNKTIEESQLAAVAELYPPMNSAFIQFNNQAAA
jgi:calcium permeable stress-gated cation channel